MRESLGLTRSIRDPNSCEIADHFVGAGVASGAIGDLGWTETNSAAGTNTRQAGGTGHPGVLRIVTGATSGNNKRLHVGSTASDANFDPTTFDRFDFVVRIPTITTLVVRVGLMQDISAAAGGTAGAYFEFDPSASAEWRTGTLQASAQNINATGVSVVANNWYLLQARREASGNWLFTVNGTLRTTHTTQLPTTACAFGVLCQTATAAARNVDLDYIYARTVLGQLWT